MYSAAKWRSENAAKNQFQRASRTLKNVSTRGHSKRMTEAYFSLYAAVLERCENEAEDIFQRSENKKSPRPGKTLRIAPGSSSSPVPQPSRERWSREPMRGSHVSGDRSAERFPVPGRSSGSWFILLPVPSHPSTGQWRRRVSSPLTAAGPRGISTLFPYPNITIVSGTLGESGIFCQVQ